MSHRGPFQQFTEVCLYCMENVYMVDECLLPSQKREREIEAKRDKSDEWSEWPDM